MPYIIPIDSKVFPSKTIRRWWVLKVFSWICIFPLFSPAGYTIANAAATVTATQLKQAVTMGQDLATYAAYEAYPAFAVAARSDGYGAY